MNKKNYIIGLDLGSSRLKATACDVSDPESPRIVSSVNIPSSGIKDGSVIDINNLSGAISDIIEKLSLTIDKKITSVVINISGINVEGEESHGIVSLDNRSGEITKSHIKNVISVARALPLGIDREILHIIPREYSIDNQQGVKNPLGLYGSKLEVASYVISAKVTLVQNLIKCVNCASLEVEETVFSGLATSSSVLTPQELSDGVILVDIGSDFTEISIFKEETLRKISIIGFGGRDFTNAISDHFRINFDHAEGIKIRYGIIQETAVSSDNTNNDRTMSNFLGVSFDQSQLNRILFEKAKELFLKIKKETEPFKKSLFSGIVMGGATCLADGFLELAEKELGATCKIAVPCAIEGDTADTTASYATSIGLIKHNLEKKLLQPSSKNIKNRFKRGLVRAKELFYDYF